MPQQEKGHVPASLPTSTSTRVCKGACLGHSGSLSPTPTSPPGPLSCSCQAMARIMPTSVNQENVFFLEKHCGSAGRPPKTPAMPFARSLTYSNPETYVPGFRERKKQICHRQAQRHSEAKHAAQSHTDSHHGNRSQPSSPDRSLHSNLSPSQAPTFISL